MNFMDVIVLLVFIISFFFGASIGSFINVLVDRLHRHQSIIFGRSFCENCKKSLTVFELIPIISYLALFGKCKNCKSKIPTRIFLVEIITGLSYSLVCSLFLLSLLSFVDLVYLLLILPIFIGIFFSDTDFGIIPDELVASFIGIASIYLFISSSHLMINHFLSGIVLFLVFLSLFFVTSGRGMGLGDVKLSFALGLFLGFPKILVAVYLAFLTGAIVSIILIAWGKKKLKKDTIPFGPFLISSSIASYFWGDIIISKIIPLFQR